MSASIRLTANRFVQVVLRKGHRRRPDGLLYDVWVVPEGHREEIRIASFMHEGDCIAHGKKLARRSGCDLYNYIPAPRGPGRPRL